MGLEKQRPYKMRLLVSKSIYAKKGPPGANQGIIYHQVQMWPWCLHPSGTPTFPPLSPQAEPISKGHCWKWQNEAEHMETLGRKGLNAIARMCLWCHFQQFPWEIGSVWAERVGQREVIWYTQKVNTAWLCLDLAVNFPQ